MIQCPYCNATIDDDARSCSRCLALIGADPGLGPRKKLPLWRHPLAALILIAVLSTGLIAISRSGPVSKKTQNPTAENPAAPAPAEPVAAAPAEPAAAPDEARRPRVVHANRMTELTNGATPPMGINPAGNPNAPLPGSYQEILNYETQITPILQAFDQAAAQIDQIFTAGDRGRVQEMTDQLMTLQNEITKIRAIRSPIILQRVHIEFSSALSIQNRGYRYYMTYFQKGEVNSLDQGRSDLETGKKKREQAQKDLNDIKEQYKTPEPTTPSNNPPAAAAPETAPPPAPPAPEPGKDRRALRDRRNTRANRTVTPQATPFQPQNPTDPYTAPPPQEVAPTAEQPASPDGQPAPEDVPEQTQDPNALPEEAPADPTPYDDQQTVPEDQVEPSADQNQ